MFYSIIAITKDGRQVTVADALEGSRLADYIEKRILSALEMKQGGASLVDQWLS